MSEAAGLHCGKRRQKFLKMCGGKKIFKVLLQRFKSFLLVHPKTVKSVPVVALQVCGEF